MDMPVKFRALAALTMLAASPLEAGERVSMRVTPVHAFEPATVRVTAVVERDAENGAMEIVADSGAFYRSSLIPLEGASLPRARQRSISEDYQAAIMRCESSFWMPADAHARQPFKAST